MPNRRLAVKMAEQLAVLTASYQTLTEEAKMRPPVGSLISSFEYIDDSGKKMFAVNVAGDGSPYPTDHTGFWDVYSEDKTTKLGGPYQYLTYKGSDGNSWQVMVYKNGSFGLRNFHPGGSYAEPENRNPTFEYLPWEGGKVILQIQGKGNWALGPAVFAVLT